MYRFSETSGQESERKALDGAWQGGQRRNEGPEQENAVPLTRQPRDGSYVLGRPVQDQRNGRGQLPSAGYHQLGRVALQQDRPESMSVNRQPAEAPPAFQPNEVDRQGLPTAQQTLNTTTVSSPSSFHPSETEHQEWSHSQRTLNNPTASPTPADQVPRVSFPARWQ